MSENLKIGEHWLPLATANTLAFVPTHYLNYGTKGEDVDSTHPPSLPPELRAGKQAPNWRGLTLRLWVLHGKHGHQEAIPRFLYVITHMYAITHTF